MIQHINALNRIPIEVLENGAIRYAEYDDEGNFIKYRYMLRADDPIEEGTIINKNLFDFIDTEFNKAGLNEEYNIPTYSGSSTTQSFTTDPTPDFKDRYYGATIDGYTILSNDTDTSYHIYPLGNAFDNTTNYPWRPPNSMLASFYAKMLFPSNIRIKPTTINIDYSLIIGSCVIKGINEDDTTDILKTLTLNSTSSSGSTATANITGNKYYKGFLYEFTNSSTGTSSDHFIYLIDLAEGEIKTLASSYVMSIATEIPTYTDRLRVKIYPKDLEAVPPTAYLNIGNLGNKEINGQIYPNYYFELAYNNTTEKFDIVNSSKWLNDIINNSENYTNDGIITYNANLIVTGDESVASNSTQHVNLGFKPRLVIIYRENNNLPVTSSNILTPIVLTQEYTGGDCAITNDGFEYKTGTSSRVYLYYIAVR